MQNENQSSGSWPSAFREDINGLRAIAVLAVVLFHFSIPGAQGGFVGVDIFFVISGYLITSIIFKKIAEQKFSVIAFYINRGRRIIPGLAFLCFALLTIGSFVLLPFDYKALGKQAAGSIAFVSNIFSWTEGGYFDGAAREKWLLHTWSLAVEWQFYLLYPLALLLFSKVMSAHRMRWAVAFITVFSFAVSVYLASTAPKNAFYFLHSRAWEMLVGAMVYLFPVQLSKRKKLVVESSGLLLIVLSVFSFRADMAWPGLSALVPVLGAASVIAAGRQESRITANRFAQFLGTISYSVYLWHWPIVVALNFFGEVEQAIWQAGGIVMSLLLGYASFRLIETPARTWKSDTTALDMRRQLPAAGALLSIIITVGLFGSAAFVTNGMPFRVSDSVRIAALEAENRNPAQKACFREIGPTSPACVIGKHKDAVSAIVLGDSHADALVTAVATALPETAKGGVLFLSYGLCPTISGVKIKGKDADHQCAKFLKDTFVKLANDYPDVPVVVINRTSFYVWNSLLEKIPLGSAPMRVIDFGQQDEFVDAQYLSEFRSRYTKSLCQLSKNRPVYVTKPIPEFSVDVPKTLAKELQANHMASDISLSLAEYKTRNQFANDIMEEAHQQCGVHLLDPTPYLCAKGKCMGSLHGRPLYFDNNHLSEYGNKFLVPMFKEIFVVPSKAVVPTLQTKTTTDDFRTVMYDGRQVVRHADLQSQ